MFQTAKIFECTKYKNNWMIYYDALLLFTAAKSQEYIQANGYHSHLIGYTLRKAHGQEVSRVGAPGYIYINQDLHTSVDQHVNLTSHLPYSYQNKFSKRTLKTLSKAYKHVWDTELGIHQGTLVHREIKEDIKQVVNKFT